MLAGGLFSDEKHRAVIVLICQRATSHKVQSLLWQLRNYWDQALREDDPWTLVKIHYFLKTTSIVTCLDHSQAKIAQEMFLILI